MGAQIEYDDSGVTFLYFLILLYGLFLIIVTYFIWPRGKKSADELRLQCQCGPCCKKQAKLESGKPRQKILYYVKIVVLLVMWGLMVAMVYKALTVERQFEEWDPYAILEIDKDASMAQIRRQYRKLSKIHHPDRGGDQQTFMNIARAHQALTNEEARENFEKYGDVDGPRAAIIGIALPSFIVDKKNSLWVLGAYMAVFMIGLPLLVGTWWYRSVKYGVTNVLIDTSKLFMYLISRSKHTPVQRLLMIISSAIEFSQTEYLGIKSRSEDEQTLNELVKDLPQAKINTRERPFCFPYAAKARLLLFAHLEKIDITNQNLLKDQEAVLQFSMMLITELLKVSSELWNWAKVSQEQKGAKKIIEPSLETFENIMRLSQHLVQANWGYSNPLLQLPHIDNDKLRHFLTRKRQVSSIDAFVKMKDTDRRNIVRSLNDEEYHNILAFCSSYPQIEMNVEVEVIDDEDKKLVSAGSLVTLRVYLSRTALLHPSDVLSPKSKQEVKIQEEEVEEEEETEPSSHTLQSNGLSLEPETIKPAESSKQASTKKPWEKNKKKKKGSSKPVVKQHLKKKMKKMQAKQAAAEKLAKEEEATKEATKEATPTESHDPNDSDEQEKVEHEEEEEEPIEKGEESDTEKDKWDEEKEWAELQESVRRDKEADRHGNTSESPIVHAPFYPLEKQEQWWLYVADRKVNRIVHPPEKVVGLKKTKELSIRLQAPDKKGLVKYTVMLTSDSFMGLSVQQELKLMIHEKKEVSGKEQWAELEAEEEEADVLEESGSELETESSEED